MNFITYESNNAKALKKLKKIKPSYFGRGDKANVFLYDEKSNGLTHVILKLNDEYLIRTKLFEEYTAIPFDHYINVFFNLKKPNIFIEESLSAYLDVAIEFLESESKINIKRKEIKNNSFINLNNRFYNSSQITRLEYLDKKTESDVTLDYVSNAIWEGLSMSEIEIEFMNWRFPDFYASVGNNGKLKLDNSNDEFLIEWLGVFCNEI